MNYRKVLTNVFKVIKFIIAIGGGLLCAGIMTSGDSNYMWNDVNLVSTGISLAFLILAICAALVVLFSVIMFFLNIRKSLNTLVSIVIFLAILGVAFSMASGEVHPAWSELEAATPTVSKWVGAGVISFYILLAGAVLAIIGSEVFRVIKFRMVK